MLNFLNLNKMFFDKMMIVLDLIIIVLLILLIVINNFSLMPLFLFLIFFVLDIVSKILYVLNNDKKENKKIGS